MTADNQEDKRNAPVILTVLRHIGGFNLEEKKIAPIRGMSGRELMFQPTLTVKVTGIYDSSPHTGGT
jgi:hypothetical protein